MAALCFVLACLVIIGYMYSATVTCNIQHICINYPLYMVNYILGTGDTAVDKTNKISIYGNYILRVKTG